jgi:hydroxylamine reductase
MSMFCYQCEQTAKGTGCTAGGVCGKDPGTAALQDLLVYAVKDISRYAQRAYQLGKRDRDVDVFMVKALFTTLTNVNLDPNRFKQLLRQAAEVRTRAQDLAGFCDSERAKCARREVQHKTDWKCR